jgi:glucosamine--fructose-6-phosphate aminotransferase (isomerizing)
MQEVLLKIENKVKEIAVVYNGTKNCLYLKGLFNSLLALKGALRLKEISCIHAEGFPAIEMKYRQIALIDVNM